MDPFRGSPCSVRCPTTASQQTKKRWPRVLLGQPVYAVRGSYRRLPTPFPSVFISELRPRK